MRLRHILVIDDNVTNLKLAENTLKPYYKVSLLISGAQTLKFLAKHRPDLILLDINLPDMDAYETLAKIKENKELENIPVIFLTSRTDSEIEAKGFELGAVDFITKPFISQSMLSRVKMHLELSEYRTQLEEKIYEKTQMIENLQDVMMLSLAELVECRDENTGGHVKRTAEYVKILANELVEAGVYSDILTPEYVKDIIKSAPLHDIGKIGINDATLLKMGSLDEDEFEYMKKHVELGAISLQKMINETDKESFLYTARDMAHYHHEKWDGTGYPSGLKGEEIPISARIMAIADVYDALTTKRPYKEPFSHEDTVNIIIEGREKGFDPNIIDVFKEISYKFEMVKFRL